MLKEKQTQTKPREMHGESRRSGHSPEYRCYRLAKERCQNPKRTSYKDYGGRGIEFRFSSFEEFLQEIGRKPTPQHSIERINNNGHYEKGNIRWATIVEQCRNRRTSHFVTFAGKTQIIADWSRENKIKVTAILNRIFLFKWCEGCAVSLPKFSRCPHKQHYQPKTEVKGN